MDLVMTESGIQRETPVKNRDNKGKPDALLSTQPEGGWKELNKLAQNSSEGPKSVLEGQVSKAKVMTRCQRPQGLKKGASTPWLEEFT